MQLCEQTSVTLRYTSTQFSILHSITDCWRCGNTSLVIALLAAVLDREYEDAYDQNSEQPSVFANVELLNPEAACILRTEYPRYRPDYSQAQRQRVYMNHCSECGAKLGDFYLHNEPNAAFWPLDAVSAAELVMRRITTPLALLGDRTSANGRMIFDNATDYNEVRKTL